LISIHRNVLCVVLLGGLVEGRHGQN